MQQIKNNFTVDLTEELRHDLKCPFKKGCRHDYCWPNVFGKSEHCGNCPDYWKNYNIILEDSIRIGEMKDESNLKLIRAEAKRDGGKFVQMDGRNEYGILLGATSTIEDYYWIWLDKDRKLRFQSCVCGYKVIDDIPAELSVLAYMKEHDKSSLLSIVNDTLKQYKHDKLITKIYI